MDISSQSSAGSFSLSQTGPNIVQDCPPGYQWDIKLRKCVIAPIDITYAGVVITYYPDSHLLSFENINDVNTVLNQLDADYENYNSTFENQYSNYTDLQLDSLDSVKSFDQLKTYRDFETKFVGYTSKRLHFENDETAWLNNDMNGADPDSLNYTIDNSENAICNNNYQLIIAGTTYQWTSSGLTVVGGTQTLNQSYSIMGTTGTCFTNYKVKQSFNSTDNTRKCELKVAINNCLIRGSAKGKVVSFRKKSGHWIRSRLNEKVTLIGTFYTSSCTQWIDFNNSAGYKKRRELKIVNRQGANYAYTELGRIQGSFYTNVSGLTGTVILQ